MIPLKRITDSFRPRFAMLSPVAKLRSPRFRLFATFLVVIIFFGNPALRAQFSGPTPSASPAANVPVKLTTDPAILYPGVREIELETGDQISVHLYESSDYNPSALRVSLDGSVQLPLIGVVHVAGLTIHQAEDLLDRRLIEAGMYRNPQITLQLNESPTQIITVTGEVHGVVPALGGNKRLFDVLSAAGGLPVTASHLITINRPGVAEPIVVDLGPDPLRSALANIPVYAHDTIVVARIGVVYVLGAFRTQGAVPLQQNTPLTLMQVAALGNGYGWEGKLNDIHIVRTTGLERKLVRVDFEKILKGKQPDPVLQANDIIFLPTSSMRAAIKVGGINTVFGILSTIIFSVR